MKSWCVVVLFASAVSAAEISVGPGRGFVRIEDAIAQAQSGDTVVIHARGDGQPYARPAIRITVPRVTVRGERDSDGNPPVLEGSGGSYMGVNGGPRGIIEFSPEADSGAVSGLRLRGARNATGNAAGVRVDQANDVTITACIIEGCDNGVFSNGAAVGEAATMRRLTVRDCTLRGNGDLSNAGQAHNLYLGGTNARIVGCRIEGATTGHNLKSRLATLLVEACVIRHAANRELDLVDAPGVTNQAGGLALVLGCLIVKNPVCSGNGNKAVIHWGQDLGGERLGNLYLVHCTVITPFAAPVIELSSPEAQVCLINDVISGPEAAAESRTLIARRGPGLAEPLSAAGVWLSGNYAPGPTGSAITLGAITVAPCSGAKTGDWRPTDAALIDSAIPLAQLPLPIAALDAEHPLRQRPPRLWGFTERGAALREVVGTGLDLGAFEAVTER